jgi:hypothetical protein
MNLYLLLQVALRKSIIVYKARISAAVVTFLFGTSVEILQLYGIDFLGSTYDPWDILMYAIGVGLGIAIDFSIIKKLERQ